MRSSIRYGKNADILMATRNISQSEYWAIQSLASTVLRFSGSLELLPEDDDFKDMLNLNGVFWEVPEIKTNSIYVINEPELDQSIIRKIAPASVEIAATKFKPKDGVVFVDHSTDPIGVILASSD
jgi:hypothetical protein